MCCMSSYVLYVLYVLLCPVCPRVPSTFVWLRVVVNICKNNSILFVSGVCPNNKSVICRGAVSPTPVLKTFGEDETGDLCYEENDGERCDQINDNSDDDGDDKSEDESDKSDDDSDDKSDDESVDERDDDDDDESDDDDDNMHDQKNDKSLMRSMVGVMMKVMMVISVIRRMEYDEKRDQSDDGRRCESNNENDNES